MDYYDIFLLIVFDKLLNPSYAVILAPSLHIHCGEKCPQPYWPSHEEAAQRLRGELRDIGGDWIPYYSQLNRERFNLPQSTPILMHPNKAQKDLRHWTAHEATQQCPSQLRAVVGRGLLTPPSLPFHHSPSLPEMAMGTHDWYLVGICSIRGCI